RDAFTRGSPVASPCSIIRWSCWPLLDGSVKWSISDRLLPQNALPVPNGGEGELRRRGKRANPFKSFQEKVFQWGIDQAERRALVVKRPEKVGAESFSALSAELSAPSGKGRKDGRTYQSAVISSQMALFQSSPKKWKMGLKIGNLGKLRALNRLQ